MPPPPESSFFNDIDGRALAARATNAPAVAEEIVEHLHSSLGVNGPNPDPAAAAEGRKARINEAEQWTAHFEWSFLGWGNALAGLNVIWRVPPAVRTAVSCLEELSIPLTLETAAARRKVLATQLRTERDPRRVTAINLELAGINPVPPAKFHSFHDISHDGPGHPPRLLRADSPVCAPFGREFPEEFAEWFLRNTANKSVARDLLERLYAGHAVPDGVWDRQRKLTRYRPWFELAMTLYFILDPASRPGGATFVYINEDALPAVLVFLSAQTNRTRDGKFPATDVRDWLAKWWNEGEPEPWHGLAEFADDFHHDDSGGKVLRWAVREAHKWFRLRGTTPPEIPLEAIDRVLIDGGHHPHHKRQHLLPNRWQAVRRARDLYMRQEWGWP